MKVLVDMNLSPSWADVLAEAGFEAVHWSEIGPASATESELMSWAVENGHVVHPLCNFLTTLDVIRMALAELEADAPRPVDGHRPLPFPAALELVQADSRFRDAASKSYTPGRLAPGGVVVVWKLLRSADYTGPTQY